METAAPPVELMAHTHRPTFMHTQMHTFISNRMHGLFKFTINFGFNYYAAR